MTPERLDQIERAFALSISKITWEAGFEIVKEVRALQKQLEAVERRGDRLEEDRQRQAARGDRAEGKVRQLRAALIEARNEMVKAREFAGFEIVSKALLRRDILPGVLP